MKTIYKGMKAQVLKSEYESTLNGVSSKHTHLILIGENICKNYEGNKDNSNVLKLVKRQLFGSEYLHAEPINKPSNTVGAMFGGNYLNAVGSMFGGIQYPIAIHDRFETQQQYNGLTQ